jgi:hypothetical protein
MSTYVSTVFNHWFSNAPFNHWLSRYQTNIR